MKKLFSGFCAILVLLLINVGYNKAKGEEKQATLPEIKRGILISDYTKSNFTFTGKKILDVAENGPVYNQAVLTGNPLTYLGQKKPGMKPEKFAPNLISKSDEHEFGSVFTEDGTEFYYGIDENGKAEIRFTGLEKGVWSSPQPLITHKRYSFNDPFLSPDENRLYYISDMPVDGSAEPKDYDIWYSIRNDSGWSEPVQAGDAINTDANEYYISFTNDGSMYFASNFAAGEGRGHDFDIYTSKFENGTFQAPVRLGETINTLRYEADVFISPDESYMIFSSARRDGYGQGDLYISFKDLHGNWKEARNMGELINTDGHELCPFVTKDGNYFFYTSNRDIYWVDADILQNYNND